MKIEDVKNICVVGAGTMGQQIALLCAVNGYQTICTDINQEMLQKADQFVNTYLGGRVKKDKMTEDQAAAARKNISFSAVLDEAAKKADYVIEAAFEALQVKRKLFADLDRLTPDHAVLATNSSTIVSSRLADATQRPARLINMHFFNPALHMKLVEVVKGPHVSDETANLCLELSRKLGKEPVLLTREVEGFLLNRILKAINKEALWMLDMGIAGAEDIDKACVLGAGLPMGPFRLLDFSGLDLSYMAMMEKFKLTGDPADRPSPSIVEKYVKGEYGQKTGKGFYDYSKK